MNLIHLFVASLLSATVCARLDIPLGFFVKADGRFKPLLVRPEPSQGEDFQKFWHNVYEDELPPTKFKLYGKQAQGTQIPWPGNVSISGDYFGVHRTNKSIELKWDRNKKVTNRKFYSCSHSYHSYRFIMVKRGFHLCRKVDIYLLPYDHKNKKAVPPVPPNLPMALFARIGTDYLPLSSIQLGVGYNWSSLFTLDYPETPVAKIWYVNHMAHIFPSQHGVDWVGSYKGSFMRGPDIERAILYLNSEWKLIHGPFYLYPLNPKKFNSVRVISNVVPDESASDCDEVEIYLLPYRRVTGWQEGGTPTSIKYLYEEDYVKPDRRGRYSGYSSLFSIPYEDFEEEEDEPGEDDYDDYW